jgi:ATP-binding cassette, subfamily B (MDR/TAP), member 1
LNISFSAGKTTFVVGRSGAGKSTLINLLLQFYSPTSGGILVGDDPFKAIDTSWVRHKVTFVQQNSYLFNETLWDNISFGCRNPRSVSSDRMEMCIEMANLQGTIGNLPNGLDTNVGLGGNLLSGGQKQRVAIARARMKNSAVLILDEFTSALDYDNRSTIMDAVRKWREGMTTIIVTHDTSNILDDDLVYVLEAGRVAASGLKKELIKGDQRAVFAEATSPGDLLHSNSFLDDDSIVPSEQSGDYLGETWFTSFESEEKTAIDKTTCRSNYHESILSTTSETSLEAQKPPAARRKPSAVHVRLSSVDSNELEHPLSKSKTAATRFNRVISRAQALKRRSGKLSQSKNAETVPTALPLHKTLLTIPSILTLRQKILLATAMVLATVHAGVTPVFSYLLSQLFDSFYTADQSEANSIARTFSISIVSLAVVDGLMTFIMHYLFEYCSQSWMDELRSRSMQRILAQSCSWFERKEHSPLQLTICLDQHAEEIRNLAGRFGSFLMIAVMTAVVAIVWSFNLKWQLTIVSLACAPVWYGVSKGLEVVNKRWERLTNGVNEEVSGVFSEAFTDVQTVRAFTLEGHFRAKLEVVLRRGARVGFKRGFYSGVFYGLAESVIIFASGKHLSLSLLKYCG